MLCRFFSAPLAALSLFACTTFGCTTDAGAPDLILRAVETASPGDAGAGKTALIIRNATIITMTDGDSAAPGVLRSVRVENGRVTDIAADLVADERAVEIDAGGRFLAPGIADMHVHYAGGEDGILFIANSVTSVRAPWGSLAAAAGDARAKNGLEPAPHIYFSGPLIDGPEPIWGGRRDCRVQSGHHRRHHRKPARQRL